MVLFRWACSKTNTHDPKENVVKQTIIQEAPANAVAATAAHEASQAKLPLRRFFGYGAGDAANNMAFSLAASFLTLYYTDVAQISPATVGTIFLVMRFVDAFTDVIAGSIVDRVNTRWGKFRPFILFGSVPLVLMALLCFSIPESMWGNQGAVIWAAVTYFLMGSVAYTFVNIPYGSLASAMTQNGTERSKLAIFRGCGSAVMQLTLALAISPSIQAFKGDAQGLQNALTNTIIVFGLVAIALYVFSFLTTKEIVYREESKVSARDAFQTLFQNKALLMLSIASVVFLVGMFTQIGVLVYYARDVMGDARYISLFTVISAGMIFVLGPVVPKLIRKFGKLRLFQLAALTGVIGAVVITFAPTTTVVYAAIGFVFFGASTGVINALMWNMEADTVEYGEWKTGKRAEGTTYGVFSFVRKLSQALAGATGVWIIGYMGYIGGQATQSDEAQWGIRIAVGLVPAIAFLGAAFLIRFYPLNDKQHREIISELAARRGVEVSEADSTGN